MELALRLRLQPQGASARNWPGRTRYYRVASATSTTRICARSRPPKRFTDNVPARCTGAPLRRVRASPSFFPEARNAMPSTARPSPPTARRRKWRPSTPTAVTSARRWRGKANKGSGAPAPKGPAASRRWTSSGVAAFAVSAASTLRPASARALVTAWPGPPPEKAPPVAEPLGRERDARRHRMPPALDGDARFDRRAHRTAEIDAGDRAAGPRRMAAREGEREGRTLEPLLEPRRQQAYDAGRPPFSRNDDRCAPLFEAKRQERLRFSLSQRLDFDLLADAVETVKLARDRARFDVVSRGQEPHAKACIADTPARVDAWADHKAQMIGSRRSVRAGGVEQSREPRAAALPHDREALDDKGAVEPDERHDIGDGGERDEVERRHEILAFAAGPEAGCPQRAVQRHERHEGHARRAEIAEPGKIVLAVGIDERRRLRQRLGGLMVIEHDHVEAELARDLKRLATDGAAVD